MSEIKYDRVKKKLKSLIENGEYAAGDKLPTESELMKKFDVSRYTIRRAAGELENEHYIYRIQGGGMYVDEWQKQRKVGNNTKMIGIITTHLADYIFPRIISGTDRILSGNGYSLILSNTHNDRENENRAIQRMIGNQVDGIIIEPSQSALPYRNMEYYQKIKDANIPALFINAHYPELDFPYLEVNDLQAEQEMTDHLIEMGHKRILGMFQVDDMQGANRLRGFLDAYLAHPEISYMSQTIMYQSTQDMNPIFKRAVSALQSNEPPTAVICYNDELAIQMMNVIKSLDLKIPDDVSIVGFDDFIMGHYVIPKLTTVQHPKEKMGVDAAKMIIDMINGKKVESKKYKLNLIYNDSIKKTDEDRKKK
ncbi:MULTISPECIES: GntR family transcriptional regulator [Lactobacillus]|uniref:GntR family transcriptional regulator n=1 Tax=Lactobacillus xujianguonis TaxID=2495899 RepID=A0A437SV09_9LACO|nr:MULTISPECIES: GntR family transcriptional regulator [Lactobacillus]RVU70766.1 GntR family transcriptional regulator [Lactobacillus xujianguonis]RVU73971.1 GntR family transcriptional regulator [Lactobacillus xujianguonis]